MTNTPQKAGGMRTSSAGTQERARGRGKYPKPSSFPWGASGSTAWCGWASQYLLLKKLPSFCFPFEDLFHICKCLAYIYICATLPRLSAHRGRKAAIPRLGLQIVVSYSLVAANLTWVLNKSTLCSEPHSHLPRPQTIRFFFRE